MQVDERRDHSFTIPRPLLSQSIGVPNACTQCHGEQEGRDDEWAAKQLKAWGLKGDKNHWATLSHRSQRGDILITRALTDLVNDVSQPAIVRASLLDQIANFPSRVSIETAQKHLTDENPMVRQAAVHVLEVLPLETRWQLLSPYLRDKSRSVRFQLAETLAEILSGVGFLLPTVDRADLERLVEEYRDSLAVSADSPATQLAIATLELRLGNIDAADKAYFQALRIEPNYVPALLNTSDHYRNSGRDQEAESLLEKALHIAPDSAAVQHSYGLLVIRKGNYEAALPFLKLAAELPDARARYAYVYGVALDHRGRTQEAVKSLVAATRRWPSQYELLMTLVLYLEKTGDGLSIYQYVSQLSAIAPGSPEVKQLVKKYSH